MYSSYKIPLLILTLELISCNRQSPPQKINTFYKEVITADDRKIITPEEAKTYHLNTKYHYEYRTGTSGHYEYNYDVKGINAKGNSVFGNINIEGKYGAGILTSDTICELEIKAEWIDHGKLKALDQKGNEYLLIVK